VSTPAEGQASQARRSIRDEVVRLSSLAVTRDVIQNVDFVNCEIVGPAVISPMNCSFIGTVFEGPIEAMILEVGEGTPVLIGTIVMFDCTFVNCRLRRVGFTATKDFVEAFRGIPQAARADDDS
jgi:hypothetical protein